MAARSESYEMKRIMTRVAACLTAPMHQLGGRCHWAAGAWNDDVARKLVDGSAWRVKSDWPPPYTVFLRDYHGKVLWDHHDHRHNEYVRFKNPRYGPESTIWRGELEQVEDVEINVDEKSKVFTNFTADTISVAYEENVVLASSHEESTSEAWHFDVSETVKIGGEVYGVSVSSSTTISGGTSGSKGDVDATSTEKSATVAINFDMQPGEVTRVHVLFNQSRTRQRKVAHAVLDFDIHLKFNEWPSNKSHAGWRNDKVDVVVRGVDGLSEFLNDMDTNYPHMDNFVKWGFNSRVKNCLHRIMRADTRTYSIDGVEERVIQDNEDFKLEQLHRDSIPAGVTVIDMSQEQHVNRYGVN